jgi:N-acetylglucosamine malate deacetylase 1
MSVLVIAAHPDDELLGCGGTIAKLSGDDVVDIVILGEGLSSRLDRRDEVDPAALRRLHGDAKRVGELLGARSVEVAGLPDNRFDELAMLDVVKRVESFVMRRRPLSIYTHHPGDLNIDHGVTFRAVLTATRPVGDCHVRDVYTFEVASSTEWAFQQIAPAFQPNVFVDISSTIDRKIDAMAVYESEARAFPHPRSAEALRAQARRWGSVTGLPYAEAFQLIRSIRA